MKLTEWNERDPISRKEKVCRNKPGPSDIQREHANGLDRKYSF